jgi:hypothetical protein
METSVEKQCAVTALAMMSCAGARAQASVTDVCATVAYAASTHYANDRYTPVGLTSDTAFGPNQIGVTRGIRHRF